jgi:transcriptional regulator GlxA family with amidase domain
MSAGTSVFSVAEAGLLDGRAATTHWSLMYALQVRFPHIDLVDKPYAQDGNILTSSGGTATADLCMHLLASGFGLRNPPALRTQSAAGTPHPEPLRLSRRSPTARVADPAVAELLAWIDQHLDHNLTLDLLAKQAFMSRRSLSRRFLAATGTTPYAWVLRRRLDRACDLLRRPGRLTVRDVALKTGFGDDGVLRQHFQRGLGCSPTEYRRRHTSDEANMNVPVTPLRNQSVAPTQILEVDLSNKRPAVDA